MSKFGRTGTANTPRTQLRRLGFSPVRRMCASLVGGSQVHEHRHRGDATWAAASVLWQRCTAAITLCVDERAPRIRRLGGVCRCVPWSPRPPSLIRPRRSRSRSWRRSHRGRWSGSGRWRARVRRRATTGSVRRTCASSWSSPAGFCRCVATASRVKGSASAAGTRPSRCMCKPTRSTSRTACATTECWASTSRSSRIRRGRANRNCRQASCRSIATTIC